MYSIYFDEEALMEMLMAMDSGTSTTSRTSNLLFEEDYWDYEEVDELEIVINELKAEVLEMAD